MHGLARFGAFAIEAGVAAMALVGGLAARGLRRYADAGGSGGDGAPADPGDGAPADASPADRGGPGGGDGSGSGAA